MRFAGPDVVLFVAGALLFSGSAYGLWVTGGFGGGDSAFDTYSLTWSEATEDQTVAEFASDATAPFNFTVDGPGVIVVTVTVDCAHSAALPAGVSTSVSVNVTGPSGLSGENSGSCGSPVAIEIPVDSVPESGTIQADSQEDAESDAIASLGGNATGAWSGEARFASQGGAVGLPTVVQYSGEVVVTLTRATAAAQPVNTR